MPRSSSRPARRGANRASRCASTACAPRIQRTSTSTTAASRLPLLGGKEKLDERLARVREGKSGQSQAAMQTFEASRSTVAAQAIGIARAAYEYALDYAKERRQFGRAIIENQAIAFTLADMKTEIDAARLLVWRAAWMGRNRIPFTNAEGSMSKVKAGEVAVWASERAMQILGGNGYTRSSRGAHAPRREDLRHLRGHGRDPAPGHLAAISGQVR